MNIPSKIVIAGQIIKIKHRKKLKSGKQHLLGQADMTNDEIKLVNGYGGRKLKEQKTASVFLHEVIHLLVDSYAMDMDEEDVARMTSGIFQVIRDNDLDFREPRHTLASMTLAEEPYV